MKFRERIKHILTIFRDVMTNVTCSRTAAWRQLRRNALRQEEKRA
jgi:hypothetical protein